MNKSHLVKRLLTAMPDLTHRQASQAVNSVMEGLVEAIEEAGAEDQLGRVRINGLGTFSVRRQKERISYGFNLTKGESKAPVKIEARRTVHFKASELLKERLR
jgi:nucleoid DNA-binding protein